MPTKVYCYHVNDENKLMHICIDIMIGKRDMTRVGGMGWHRGLILVVR